jgi:hypothetical protein
MTQPSRVLYLPPGVMPTPAVPPPGAQGVPSGIPFDRAFFERILPPSVAAFGQQINCDQPVVQLLTVDGVMHYVKGLAGVADSWVALHTQPEDADQAIEMFVPYQTIFRVSIVPCEEHTRKLGFILGRPKIEVPSIPAPPAAEPAVAAPPERTAKKRPAAKKS